LACIEAYIDIEAELMRRVHPLDRAAARPRNLLDIDIAQAGGLGLARQGLNGGNGAGGAPERRGGEVDGLIARPGRRQFLGSGDAADGRPADDPGGPGRRAEACTSNDQPGCQDKGNAY
jgi:hypothetical protein